MKIRPFARVQWNTNVDRKELVVVVVECYSPWSTSKRQRSG
jgi:hypothetical protein